jgi:capsular exopolysaccharide synthesis family protein
MKKIQVTKDTGIETKEENVFRQLLFRYLPYWPLFMVLILLGAGAAYFYLKIAVPVYETTASILIKDETKGSDESKLMESLNQIGAKKIVENEIEVIHSRSILTEVVKDLGLYAPEFEKDRFISRPAYITSPVIVELQQPDSLVKTDEIPFVFSPGTQTIIAGNNRYPVNQWVSTVWGVIRFANNPLYRTSPGPHQYYFAFVNVKKVVNDLSDRLDVSASGKLSSVIDLKLKDAVPERGEAILSDVINVYNKVSFADKNQLAANTLDFVDKRLRNMEMQLDSVEKGIEKFRTDKDVVDISAQGQQYLENVGQSDLKASDLNEQLAELDQVEKYVESKNDQAGIVPSTFGIGDKLLSQLVEELYNSEIQYERLKKTTAENNPILISLKNEIDKIKPSILENINSQRKTLEAGRDNINETSTKYSSMLRTIPLKERQLVEISRQQAIKNSIYSFLLQKKEETALSLNSTVPDSRLIDKAESSFLPIGPNKPLIFAFAILVAIVIGIVWIGLKELLNNKILFRNEIENMTMIPVLGELVYDKSKRPIVIKSGEKSLIAEQFRFLRGTLSKAGSIRAKRIMVTSSITGEGKSFVAANLAASIALAGKKVVLVDLDLHKPGLHSIFDMENTKGVSDYLTGQAEASQLIMKTSENENLFVIPAGPLAIDPSELILNGKLKSLMNYLETVFDVMIIDTAPALAITDAYIIGSRCDANLYIVRHGYTPKIHVQLLDENTGMYRMKNIGIVFNGVKKRGTGKYGYGYGYGYNFDYGYGYPERKST